MLYGDSGEVLKSFRDNAVGFVLTDPPYGLGEVKDVGALLTAWINGDDPTEHVGRGGFMSRDWDRICPPPSLWAEVYRVLKPGGYLLCFAGTRTADLIGISIRLAGFELRDEFSVHGLRVDWIYSSGFPKSLSIGKAIDKAAGVEREVIGEYNWPDRLKRKGLQLPDKNVDSFRKEGNKSNYDITAPATPEAAEFEGFGTGLKPAHEPVLIFRKPLEKGLTIAENCLKWGTGAFNVDAGRIDTKPPKTTGQGWDGATGYGRGDNTLTKNWKQPSGRFPSNVIFVHDPGCKRVGERRVKGTRGEADFTPGSPSNIPAGCAGGTIKTGAHYADPDGMETVPEYICSPECAVRELDRQSSDLHSSYTYLRGNKPTPKSGDGMFAGGCKTDNNTYFDIGTASRFFKQIEYAEPDFVYQAKESKAMRNAGCEGLKKKKSDFTTMGTQTDKGLIYRGCNPENQNKPEANYHPTVKPVSLLSYFVSMFSRAGQVVLDPFMGSGSTGVACLLEGREFIGIDNEAEYVEIAKARFDYWGNPEVRKAYLIDGELPARREELPLFDK